MVRPLCFSVACVAAGWLSGAATAALAHEAEAGATCRLTIEVVDTVSGKPLAAVVRLRDDAGNVVSAPELMNRGVGVPDQYTIHQWQLFPAASQVVTVPQTALTMEAFQGLETELAIGRIDLNGKAAARIQIPLKRFFAARKAGLQAGNTHIHLQKMGRVESERYLLEVARAEQLDTLYISYLERAVADLEYTTNKYSSADLRRLTQASHQSEAHQHEFDNGQEHRHNFAGFGEGYGHVMFLHLQHLVKPVSIGPGIMKKGFDQPALRPGIDHAHEQEASVIWCHNRYGLEDIPSWVAGKLHANNIFDGGTRGSYRHSFYRYLNAGLRTPFSTGTDWSIYDFNRVYVSGDAGEITVDRRLDSVGWLKKLREGRSFITNGPLLELTVNGRPPGTVLQLKSGEAMKVSGRAVGRLNFERLELVNNGKVVATSTARAEDGHFTSELTWDVAAEKSCWIALRTPPPYSTRDADLARRTPLNEYGRELFSHTSPVYVHVDGRPVRIAEAVHRLRREMEDAILTIQANGKFKSPANREAVLKVYRDAIRQLK